MEINIVTLALTLLLSQQHFPLLMPVELPIFLNIFLIIPILIHQLFKNTLIILLPATILKAVLSINVHHIFKIVNVPFDFGRIAILQLSIGFVLLYFYEEYLFFEDVYFLFFQEAVFLEEFEGAESFVFCQVIVGEVEICEVEFELHFGEVLLDSFELFVISLLQAAYDFLQNLGVFADLQLFIFQNQLYDPQRLPFGFIGKELLALQFKLHILLENIRYFVGHKIDCMKHDFQYPKSHSLQKEVVVLIFNLISLISLQDGGEMMNVFQFFVVYECEEGVVAIDFFVDIEIVLYFMSVVDEVVEVGEEGQEAFLSGSNGLDESIEMSLYSNWG